MFKEIFMERDTRFELATSTLARLHSTTELVPLVASVFSGELWESQIEILKKIAGGIGHTLSPYPIRFLSNKGLEEDHTLPQSFQAALDPLPLCTTRARAMRLK